MNKNARKLAHVVDEIVSRYERGHDQYDTKQIEDEVRLAYDAGLVLEDPVTDRIARAVKDRDRASRTDADGTLDFGDFSFPHVLTVGRNERIPAAAATWEHVASDQAVKHANKLAQDEAFLRLERRNLALMPYMMGGQKTVAQAIEAYRSDHPDQPRAA